MVYLQSLTSSAMSRQIASSSVIPSPGEVGIANFVLHATAWGMKFEPIMEFFTGKINL